MLVHLADYGRWDYPSPPRPPRQPPVRRPSAGLTNPLAVLVRALSPAQFRAWRRFLRAAGIHPYDFADDVAAPLAQVPPVRRQRYQAWLLARGYADLLAPAVAPSPGMRTA